MATAVVQPISSLSAAVAASKNTGFASASVPVDAGAFSGKHDGYGTHNLLTPPSSLSPQFKPFKDRAGNRSPSAPVDSDIDLQDAVEHAQAQDQPTALSSAALSGLEASAAITPSMLAKHHLPEILLPSGPMPIRYILNCLTQTVPGFSRIAPPKARRLVVSALEIRGGGGPEGDVEFEKVGWGRWDARIRGQPPREGRPGAPGSLPVLEHARHGVSPPVSVADSYAMSHGDGLQIPRGARKNDAYTGSWVAGSMLSSRGNLEMDARGMNAAEHEADKMSLDGSESYDDSDDVPVLGDLDDDATDEEDWAGIGPDALRYGSAPRGSAPVRNHAPARPSTGRRRSSHQSHGVAKSIPGPRHASYNHRSTSHSRTQMTAQRRVVHSSSYNPSAFPMASLREGAGIKREQEISMALNDSQERAAVEALLQLGSM